MRGNERLSNILTYWYINHPPLNIPGTRHRTGVCLKKTVVFSYLQSPAMTPFVISDFLTLTVSSSCVSCFQGFWWNCTILSWKLFVRVYTAGPGSALLSLVTNYPAGDKSRRSVGFIQHCPQPTPILSNQIILSAWITKYISLLFYCWLASLWGFKFTVFS